MSEPKWIDAKTACTLLGVKPQTLYAYVSRKQVRVSADTSDARRSLYAQTDIDALLKSNRRPRARLAVAEQAIRWGDPVLTTAISEVRDGMLWVRGKPITNCVSAMTLEDMAAHLWNADSVETAQSSIVPNAETPTARALLWLAGEVASASPMEGQRPEDICEVGAALLSGIANAMLGSACNGPIHTRIGEAWDLSKDGSDAVRRTLVALSDHELNPSTFAVRVCASTGASLPAALIAGMSTLSGPRHGGAPNAALRTIQDTLINGAEAALAARRDASPYTFGFSHPLYPEGDPRAHLFLEGLPQDAPALDALQSLSAKLELPPNVDAALAALALSYSCPDRAGETLFAIGRTTGWIAHAMEQVASGGVIRPRARFLSDEPKEGGF